MPLVLRRVLEGLCIVALQWLILGRLQLWGAFPDAVLLYVAWMSLRYGRFLGSVTGFSLGFLMDVLYDTWGIHMFAKTVIGFVVGIVSNEERASLIVLPGQAFWESLVTALLHNGILLIFFVLDTGTRTATLVTVLWIGSALYTGALGTLASLFVRRK